LGTDRRVDFVVGNVLFVVVGVVADCVEMLEQCGP